MSVCCARRRCCCRTAAPETGRARDGDDAVGGWRRDRAAPEHARCRRLFHRVQLDAPCRPAAGGGVSVGPLPAELVRVREPVGADTSRAVSPCKASMPGVIEERLEGLPSRISQVTLPHRQLASLVMVWLRSEKRRGIPGPGKRGGRNSVSPLLGVGPDLDLVAPGGLRLPVGPPVGLRHRIGVGQVGVHPGRRRSARASAARPGRSRASCAPRALRPSNTPWPDSATRRGLRTCRWRRADGWPSRERPRWRWRR